MEPRVLSMEQWREKWVEGKTRWQKDAPHPMLVKYLESHLRNGRTCLNVFVPLCGKSVDLAWLAEQGATVYAVEASDVAIRQFFEEQKLECRRQQLSDDVVLHQSADGRIKIFECDLLSLPKSLFGCQFDVVWDRGSFVAINVDDRERYIRFIDDVSTPQMRWLLVGMDYDQDKWPGPPHYVTDEHMKALFGNKLDYELMERVDVLDFQKEEWGVTFLDELIYIVKRKTE